MSDFVFPQDEERLNSDGLTFTFRHGGLTKRELFAAMFYAAFNSDARSTLPREVGSAVHAADRLIAELEKTHETPR